MHDCDVSKFNRKSLRKYFKLLCEAIDMKRCELYFWDDYGVPEIKTEFASHQRNFRGAIHSDQQYHNSHFGSA